MLVSDHLCAVSWRARPRSFVSLMTLYESNFIRLGWLLPDLERLRATAVATAGVEPPLEVTVLERCRYTTTLRLSCLFDDGAGVVRDPWLVVRVYHDARLAEVRGVAREQARSPRRLPAAAACSRWAGNMLLNKWLEYCADRGYRFAPAGA